VRIEGNIRFSIKGNLLNYLLLFPVVAKTNPTHAMEKFVNPIRDVVSPTVVSFIIILIYNKMQTKLMHYNLGNGKIVYFLLFVL
jgi:hypothetical protein